LTLPKAGKLDKEQIIFRKTIAWRNVQRMITPSKLVLGSKI
jgi:hypothetical protein